jgi:hypothetical protein
MIWWAPYPSSYLLPIDHHIFHLQDIAESLFSQLSKMDPSRLTLKEFASVR